MKPIVKNVTIGKILCEWFRIKTGLKQGDALHHRSSILLQNLHSGAFKKERGIGIEWDTSASDLCWWC